MISRGKETNRKIRVKQDGKKEGRKTVIDSKSRIP